MKGTYQSTIAAALRNIPAGSFEIQYRSVLEDQKNLCMGRFTAETQGKGKIERFLVFPGIEVSRHQYLAEEVVFHHNAINTIMQIDHCGSGRVEWNMCSGASVSLGAGDMCLHSLENCADSEVTLPLGYYDGISVMVDLHMLKETCPEILRESGFDAEKIYQKFCAVGKPFGIPSNRRAEAVFSSLYGLPERLRVPYYKLKAQEVLLYLNEIEFDAENEFSQYDSHLTELIKEIRNFLVLHIDKRFTIEELAKKYLINTSSLKSVFKAVYGMPIASYVKEYRMQQASKLLRETDDSIAVIAEKVGYETQGKFTKAFKERLQILPTEYRKRYKNSEHYLPDKK